MANWKERKELKRKGNVSCTRLQELGGFTCWCQVETITMQRTHNLFLFLWPTLTKWNSGRQQRVFSTTCVCKVLLVPYAELGQVLDCYLEYHPRDWALFHPKVISFNSMWAGQIGKATMRLCELGNFESFVFFFNLYKHASEGQVAALFRVKRLQPCGTAECYTLVRQGLAMYYVCMWLRKLWICDAVHYLYETFF